MAIDCSGPCCSLALLHAGVMHAVRGEAGRTHLEDVLPLVAELFAHAGLRPQACDAFAFASGPGSFTGLRLACTIAQGLALATDRPVVPVGHFEALFAALGAEAQVDGARVLGLLDARMDQAYWAVAAWQARDANWQFCAAPAVGDRAGLAVAAAQWRVAACAGDPPWIAQYLGAEAPPVRAAAIDAACVARLAAARYALGGALAPEAAAPTYVRDRVAQTVAQRLAARAARGS